MKKKTHEEYVAELAIKNPYIEVIEKYITAKEKIKHRCLKHNIVFDIDPDHALKGRGCKLCEKEHRSIAYTKSFDRYRQDLLNKNPNIELVDEYINARTKVRHKCIKHNYVWLVSPDSVLRGAGCPLCLREKISEKNSLSHEEYVLKLMDINPYIIPIDKYTIGSVKIAHKCLVCGNEWNALPSSLLNGIGCPQCYMSHGEREVSVYLREHNISYISQYIFNNCKYRYVLPFDFYLTDYNICIEYDGGQHFKPVKWFGGEEGFRKTQERDKIKNQYCLDNDIPLLRIRYDQDVAKTIEDFLLQYKINIKEAAS